MSVAHILTSAKQQQMLFWGMVAVLIAGALLRFYGLEFQSLWNDELATWEISKTQSLSETIKLGVIPDVHPPGYQAFYFYWMKLFGDSEFILRLPSVIFGIGSIAAIALLAKELYSWREGIIATALLSVSYLGIFYSQEARAYSALLFFSITSTYFFWRSTHEKEGEQLSLGERLPWIFGYLLTAFVLIYIHYFGLLLALCFGLISIGYMAVNRRIGIPIFTTGIVLFCTYLPWLPSFFSQMKGKENFWIKAPEPEFLLDFISIAFNIFSMSSLAAALIVLLPIFIIFTHYKNSRKARNATLFLLFLIAAPTLAAYIKSVTSSPILTTRNLIIILPFIYIIAARIISLYVQRSKVVGYSLGLILITWMMFNLFDKRQYYSKVTKTQFREVVEYTINIESKLDGTETIGVVGFAWRAKYFNYYFEKFNSPFRVEKIFGKSSDTGPIDSFINNQGLDRLWYVTGHRVPDNAFVQHLKHKYKLIQEKNFYSASAYLFDIRN